MADPELQQGGTLKEEQRKTKKTQRQKHIKRETHK